MFINGKKESLLNSILSLKIVLVNDPCIKIAKIEITKIQLSVIRVSVKIFREKEV